MSEVNLQILQDYSDEEAFLQELQNAQDFLQPNQAKPFFKIVLQHFEEMVPLEIGQKILSTLAHVLCVKKNMSYFAAGDFALLLPFRQKNLTNDVLDVLYTVITRCPEAVTEDLANLFAKLIIRNPKKTLVLISVYTQFFDELENPYPLIDMLFNGEQYFLKEATALDYLNLLMYLTREFPSFRDGRSNEVYQIALKGLKSENEEVVEISFNCLATVAAYLEDIKIPTKEIRQYISNKAVRMSVLNYLAVCPPFEESNPKFIKSILKIAQDEVLATLVLMKLCSQSVEVGSILTEDSRWMNADLPTPEDTFRLFLVVFGHKELRNKLSRTPEFVPFLQSLVDLHNVPMLNAICTILRRVKVTRDLIKRMSDARLISSYLETSDEIGTVEARYESILFCDTMSKIAYTKEFVPMCEALVETVENEDENFGYAVALATDFCEHERCLNKLKKCGMVNVLKNSQYASKKRVKELIQLLTQ
ncbi:hypothetical protein TVAG_166100 [Trichomonas vaginalis G3]|uniref:Uncharacterized protein n=1 Tax=Trichomonas vaginalis (strain ATCC PRA-98 / G3) TaxID=412133 RepID=A2DE17_TRIV3|nr:protein kinase protein [Trichomonas vaginalis G3]EAY21235.1 hypothetical protein TVAG_166100 [Trichomonas vaginalis G3]KAI5548798.1 protein kinase protein [Trichomonas vaginalis G3]|eukprot:XP_001582221.1 hypothetical protein [Trichomonas vaginalis G3]